MTNKLEITREQLEKCLRDATTIRFEDDKHILELRALLARPPLTQSLPTNGAIIADLTASIAQQAKMIEHLKAAQHQGEPIAAIPLSDCVAGWHPDYNDGLFATADAIVKLYREQPAPVSADLACDRAYRNGLQRGFGLGENGQVEQYHKEFAAYQREIVGADTAQPAPVAVVLPPEDGRRTSFDTDEAYQNGWNACLDKVKELNQTTCCGSCPGGCIVEAGKSGKARDA